MGFRTGKEKLICGSHGSDGGFESFLFERCIVGDRVGKWLVPRVSYIVARVDQVLGRFTLDLSEVRLLFDYVYRFSRMLGSDDLRVKSGRFFDGRLSVGEVLSVLLFELEECF